METRLGSLSTASFTTGLPPTIPNPVKPEWFFGQHTAQLGVGVGLSQFGINHVILDPGAYSALRHWHEGEDEFVLVLSGELVLIDNNGEHTLVVGDFVGFPAGAANAHHLTNRSAFPARFLEMGTRKVGVETIHYPDEAEAVRTVERDAAGRRVIR